MAALGVEAELITDAHDVDAGEFDHRKVRADQFRQGVQSPQRLDLGVRVRPSVAGELKLHVALDQGTKAQRSCAAGARRRPLPIGPLSRGTRHRRRFRQLIEEALEQFLDVLQQSTQGLAVVPALFVELDQALGQLLADRQPD
ncbi:hypothetical protein D9M69_597660 [compost metagenome]